MKTIITIMTFFAVLVACQNKTGKDKENTTNSSLASCEQSNSLKIEQYDFSKLLLDNRIKYIGYIGIDYQKMDISFDSIKKATDKEYLVWGKSKVKDNICDFKGHINIIAINNYDTLKYDVDGCQKDIVIKRGDMIANYKFDENINQQGSGTFTGKLTTHWYINEKGILLYDDVFDNSKAYVNNQYDGIWQSYKTKKIKKCVWGQYETPNSNLKTDLYDFSKLLLDNRTKYLGYIGIDYQKMDISFDSIKKTTNTEYLVWGKSKVKDNICDFKGNINIIAIHNYDTLEYGLDSCMKNNVIKQGDMIANYKFDEDINQQGSGTFTGKLTTYWYINDKGLLLYDDISDYSDAYENNQYDGIWQSYKTKKTKKCAWGQYRIPNCGDLDVGAGDFFPNPKYFDKGWKEYSNAIFPD